MPHPKYPVLYKQRVMPGFGGVHMDAYDITRTRFFLGQIKLTDILDELYQLRREKHERKASKEITKDGSTDCHPDHEVKAE